MVPLHYVQGVLRALQGHHLSPSQLAYGEQQDSVEALEVRPRITLRMVCAVHAV